MRAKPVLSERGVYEIPLTEEMVVDQIRQYLELIGARVTRHVEIIPSCRCGHYKSQHVRRIVNCTKCVCTMFRWTRVSEGGIPDLTGYFPKFKVMGPANNRFNWPVHFEIEVKKPGGRHREKQTQRIEQGREDGCFMMFADSVEAVVAQFLEWGMVCPKVS